MIPINQNAGLNELMTMIGQLQKQDITISENDSAYKINIRCHRQEEIKTKMDSYFNSYPATIPKKIHQVWIGPYPPPWKWIDSFRKEFTAHFPGWEYFLWREDDIARLNLVNRDLYEYEEYPAGKTDILRYELLYQYGGIYIDADTQWLNRKPLDELLTQVNTKGIFSGREDNVMMANGVIGCSPGNPLMHYLVKLLQLTFPFTRLICGYPNWIASGPRFFSEVLTPFETTVFPQKHFYPLSWLQDLSNVDTGLFPDSYMIQFGYSSNHLHLLNEQ